MAPVALLCLPCAGASASLYWRWQRSLPAWVRLIPVELPGRGARLAEAFVTDFDVLVAQLCREHEASLQGRYVLYGHSMGALLAHGMAVQCRRRSLALPELLFAAASPAPSRRDPDFFAGKSADTALVADLRKQGGTPDEVFESPELLSLTLATLRADYAMCAGYRYPAAAPLPTPIEVFAGRQDDIETARLLAWERETTAGCSLQWFDGGHFFMRRQETPLLGALVRRMLTQFPEDADVPAARA